ncbi:hypothetical protein OAR29_01075 [Rhodospirillales bacterium]|nr:hypothetical protein [Rhodospirillales bacterium]
MAISESIKNHSYVLNRIVSDLSLIEEYTFKMQNTISKSAYSINLYSSSSIIGKIGVFIKTSEKRRSPWNYTFTLDHQTEIDLMKEEYDEVFTILVNGTDGVVCFDYTTLKELLDDNHENTEWIRVKRDLGEQYSVSGKDGKLTRKISDKEFPRSVLEFASRLQSNKLSPELQKPKKSWFSFR